MTRQRKATPPTTAASLRQRAEALARAAAAPPTAAPDPTLHELRVHQLELELQNEELRRAQAELEALRARYFELYDQAPVGYCTVNEKGLIQEANLTAASLLGVARGALVRQPLSRFILKADQNDYYRHRRALLTTGTPQGFDLRLRKADGTSCWAHLATAPAPDAAGGTGCWVILSDITQRKRAEELLVHHSAQLEARVQERTAGLATEITERQRTQEELRASREQLRALAASLQAEREADRTHLAREIHDVLAQELTRLKLGLAWLHTRLTGPATVPPPATLAARVVELSQVTDAAMLCVQTIATGLRPAVLDSLGLGAAVEWQTRDFGDHAGLPCQVQVPKEELPVDRAAATAAFRILQESLTNVQRHAQASRVKVRLRSEAGYLVLRIEDNGRGMSPAVLNHPMSIGLAGMRERAHLLGGHFQIVSQPGAGTTVEVRLPLAPPARGPVTHAGGSSLRTTLCWCAGA
jgi:PAS domain S-box-containing protein